MDEADNSSQDGATYGAIVWRSSGEAPVPKDRAQGHFGPQVLHVFATIGEIRASQYPSGRFESFLQSPNFSGVTRQDLAAALHQPLDL